MENQRATIDLKKATEEYGDRPSVLALLIEADKLDRIRIKKIADLFKDRIPFVHLYQAIKDIEETGADLDFALNAAAHYPTLEKQKIIAELGVIAEQTRDARDVATLAQIAINHSRELPPITFERAYFLSYYHSDNPTRRRELQEWFLEHNSENGTPLERMLQLWPLHCKVS